MSVALRSTGLATLQLLPTVLVHGASQVIAALQLAGIPDINVWLHSLSQPELTEMKLKFEELKKFYRVDLFTNAFVKYLREFRDLQARCNPYSKVVSRPTLPSSDLRGWTCRSPARALTALVTHNARAQVALLSWLVLTLTATGMAKSMRPPFLIFPGQLGSSVLSQITNPSCWFPHPLPIRTVGVVCSSPENQPLALVSPPVANPHSWACNCFAVLPTSSVGPCSMGGL